MVQVEVQEDSRNDRRVGEKRENLHLAPRNNLRTLDSRPTDRYDGGTKLCVRGNDAMHVQRRAESVEKSQAPRVGRPGGLLLRWRLA